MNIGVVVAFIPLLKQLASRLDDERFVGALFLQLANEAGTIAGAMRNMGVRDVLEQYLTGIMTRRGDTSLGDPSLAALVQQRFEMVGSVLSPVLVSALLAAIAASPEPEPPTQEKTA